MTPCAALLSNGRYRVIVSGAGTGASFYGDLALTRWSQDPTRDAEGMLLYVQDLDRAEMWTAGRAPGARLPDDAGAECGYGRARAWRNNQGMEAAIYDLADVNDAVVRGNRIRF